MIKIGEIFYVCHIEGDILYVSYTFFPTATNIQSSCHYIFAFLPWTLNKKILPEMDRGE